MSLGTKNPISHRRTVFRVKALDDDGLAVVRTFSSASGLALRLLLRLQSRAFGPRYGDVPTSYRDLCTWLDPALAEHDGDLFQARREVAAALKKLESNGLVERLGGRTELILHVAEVGDDRDLLPLGLVRNGWLSGPDGWMFTGSNIRPHLTGAGLLVLIRCLAVARRHRLVPPARGIRRPTVSRYFRVAEAEAGLSMPVQRGALKKLQALGLVHVRRAQGARWICVLDPDMESHPPVPKTT